LYPRKGLFAVNCITILASVGDRISVGKLSEMKKQNRNTTFRLQKHVLGSTSYRTNSAYTPFTKGVSLRLCGYVKPCIELGNSRYSGVQLVAYHESPCLCLKRDLLGFETTALRGLLYKIVNLAGLIQPRALINLWLRCK